MNRILQTEWRNEMKRMTITLAALFAMAVPAMAGHVATIGTGTCGSCHRTNLVTQHGGFAAPVCQTCHDSTATSVTDTIAAGVNGQPYTCSNCHGGASHLQKHPDYVNNFAGYDGVEPVYNGTASWAAAASYTRVSPAVKEYQLCVKCHSSNGLGATVNGVSGVVGPSGTNLTDQALEFNPNNLSAHPVRNTLNQQTGSYAPKALTAAQMVSPWTNVGSQTIKCSDCHEASTATIGPQGATVKYLLKGPRRLWPYNASGKLWTLGDLKNNTNNWSNDLFCNNCHVLKGSSSFLNNVHNDGDHHADFTINGVNYKGAPCVSCHIVVPHGGKRSRMIGYGYQSTSPDPSPYVINNNVNLMRGFRKAGTPNSYNEGNCWSSSGECGDHNSSKMTYDW